MATLLGGWDENNKNDKMQLFNIERYLEAFNIEVENFSSIEFRR